MVTMLDRIDALCEEDRDALKDVIEAVVDTMESAEGAFVALVDRTGGGRADLLSIGNQLLVPELLLCGTNVASMLGTTASETVQ